MAERVSAQKLKKASCDRRFWHGVCGYIHSYIHLFRGAPSPFWERGALCNRLR